MKRTFPISLAVAGMLLLVVVVFFGWQRYGAINSGQVTSTGVAAIGGPFALTDQTGKAVTDQTYKGKWLLVFFGFTYCPDVCPTDLLQIALAVDQLGEAGEMVQPIFITVDPDHDTPAHLKQYMSLFHPRFIGLTGDADAIRAIARAYRVYYKKVEWDDRSGYTVDHSAFIYLMGRDGEYLGFFPPGASAERLVEAIRPRLGGHH
jgi:cytochrome oxidase Cu insertion factor (SCO1/SenC/PrrC family)